MTATKKLVVQAGRPRRASREGSVSRQRGSWLFVLDHLAKGFTPTVAYELDDISEELRDQIWLL
ncbi:hypothetical protein [Gordonia rhizosphera]|uniref:Uncharacterized protein n=1 Tax=Gordonia rhizosphera NBRC 16068 TaxID=1108045 RepID=K6VMP3_9ACTN|nr:hypothetical protein [Gordonia rhizosphera]GAB88170.1 hypothetical protein GORHZ_006_00390 [Gordonia rhizosphera NBRC 16068]